MQKYFFFSNLWQIGHIDCALQLSVWRITSLLEITVLHLCWRGWLIVNAHCISVGTQMCRKNLLSFLLFPRKNLLTLDTSAYTEVSCWLLQMIQLWNPNFPKRFYLMEAGDCSTCSCTSWGEGLIHNVFIFHIQDLLAICLKTHCISKRFNQVKENEMWAW